MISSFPGDGESPLRELHNAGGGLLGLHSVLKISRRYAGRASAELELCPGSVESLRANRSNSDGDGCSCFEGLGRV
jgi:hypothetical protein